MPGARMGGKKEKRGRREEDRVGVAMGVDGREVDAGDAVENGVDKVDQDEKKGKTKREVLGDGSEFVAENGKGSVGDKNEGARSEKKKKKRKQEVGRDKKELEKAVKKGSTLSEGNESGGGKSVSEVPQIVEDGDGHMHDGDFENKKERLQIQTKKKKNKKHQDFKKMDDVDAAFSATKHFVDDRHEAGVQERNKSLGKNIEEIKDTDEGGIKKKKKKKGRRDSDPVGDNQKKEEASRSSDAEIAKKDVHEKERSKRKKQKGIEGQGHVASGDLDQEYMESEADARFTNDNMGSEEKKPIKDRKKGKKDKAAKDGIDVLKKNVKRVSSAEPVAIVVRGKKFSKEEDEPVKKAVYNEAGVAANKEDRLHKAVEAQTIVAEETKQFEAWRDSFVTVPTIKKLRAYAERIRIAELEKCLSKLGDDVRKKTKRAVDDLSRSIVNKLLHGPMQHLRCDGDDGRTLSETLENMHALNRIFSLDADITQMEQKIKAKIEQSQK